MNLLCKVFMSKEGKGMIKPTSIGNKLKYIGGLLFFIIIALIILNVYMNERVKKDSLVINVSGLQRMLTQKMSKEIFYIKHKDTIDFRELNTAMDTFNENLYDLIHGNKIKGIYAPEDIEIKKKLQEVEDIWIPFKEKITYIKESIRQIKPSLESLIQKNTYLLNLADDIVKIMVKNKMEGVYIDFSGRQRMLTQRMGLFMERYLRTDNEDDYLKFISAKKLFESTLLRFKNDKQINKIKEVHKKVEECYIYWQNYNRFITRIIEKENNINDAIAYIYQMNIKLLNTMDSAVWLYTEYSEGKTAFFDKVQYVALILILLILLYTFLVVKDIVRHLDEFIKKAKALEEADLETLTKTELLNVGEESEAELIEASAHIGNFVQKVNSAMSHSKDAISKAEAAVKELQYLADDVEDALQGLNVDEKEKNSFDKSVNATEDIAIESAENLLHVKKMLEKLQSNLNSLIDKSDNSSFPK